MKLIFMAPDGAGGGGSSGGVPLGDWIKRLNEADKKDRKGIMEELAGALGIKLEDAYKRVKETGWDPKNNTTEPPAGDSARGGITVTLRHTSPYPHYRRAGLLLTSQWKPYAVTAEQLAALKADTWVAFQEPAGPDKT